MSTMHTAEHPGTGMAPSSGFRSLPHTKLGRWAMWLAFAFVIMFAVNIAFTAAFGMTTNEDMRSFSENVLPFYGIALMLVGLSSGVTALIAMIRDHERSWLLWAALVPFSMMLFFLIGEFAVPH